MIILFRKLRNQFVRQKKVSSYLLYALGEILLVVIGILIALGINNRSEYTKDRKKEIYVLNSIKSNLYEDIGSLYEIIYANQQLLFRLDTISTILSGSEDWPVLTLTTHLEALTEVYSFTTNRTGIDQMISSSQMEIVENRQLIEQLLLYYRDIEENTKGNETALAEYSRNTFGPKLLMYDNMSDPMKPLSSYRRDPFFSNAVAVKQKHMRLMLADYLKIQKKAQRLGELMGQELERLG